MKKILYIFSGVVFILSSCTITKKSIPSASLNVQVNLDMNNLEYIGDVTGSATQRYVLWIPYGGRKYYVGMASLNQQQGLLSFGVDRAMNNALYDAFLSKPDADFILPVSAESKTQRLFLGKSKTVTIRAKVFKIKIK